MVRKTKQDAEKTRNLLLDTAEVIFLEKGYASASLDEIARAAKLTRGAVYWHFKNKYDLFEAMVQRVKMPLDEMMEQALQDKNPLQALKELCIYILTNLAGDERARRVFTIQMFKCEHMPDCDGNREEYYKCKKEELVEKFSKTFGSAKKAGLLAKNLSPENAALALHSHMTGIFYTYLYAPDEMDIKKLAPKFIDIFFRGIAA